jgi:signal peptidase I
MKGRRPWVAGLLSLVVPGLGQVYNGEPRKAFIYLGLFVIGTPVLVVFALPLLVPGYLVLVAIRLYLVFDAVSVARKLRDNYAPKPYNTWYSYAGYAAGVLLFTSFIKAYVVQSYRMSADSMFPTLRAGEHVSVNNVTYGIRMPLAESYLLRFAKPKRGDVISFMFPEDRSKDFLKRVIAVEGDLLEIRSRKIYIDGQVAEDPYAHFDDEAPRLKPHPGDNFGPAHIPPGHVFVLGDNRDKSYDSRFWGFLKLDDIKGKAFVIYWSWENGAVRWDRMGRM